MGSKCGYTSLLFSETWIRFWFRLRTLCLSLSILRFLYWAFACFFFTFVFLLVWQAYISFILSIQLVLYVKVYPDTFFSPMKVNPNTFMSCKALAWHCRIMAKFTTVRPRKRCHFFRFYFRKKVCAGRCLHHIRIRFPG